MKPSRNLQIHRLLRNMVTVLLPFIAASHAYALLIDDFEGGIGNWREITPFHGNLEFSETGGNPGGFMCVTDTTSGGWLRVEYTPSRFDLTNYHAIQWDEFVYDNGPKTIIGTGAVLFGSDGTIYEQNVPLLSLNTWVTRSVSFESEWTLVRSGSMNFTFEQVLQDAGIGFTLDTSTTIRNRESGVDNLSLLLVPEPSSFGLAMIGLLRFCPSVRVRWR